MKDFLVKIHNELNSSKRVKKIDIHSFDSGAFMIDFWTDKEFYCLQLFDNKFGLSRITEEIDLSTIPDHTYNSWEDFKFNLFKVIK